MARNKECFKSKKSSTAGKMMTIFLLVSILLTGCTARELEDRKFPLVLEINAENGELILACAWSAVKDEEGKQSQAGGSTNETEVKQNTEAEAENDKNNIVPWVNDEKITRVSGKNLEEALKNMQSLQDKYVDYSQVKAILWGKDLVKNTELEQEVLAWLESSPIFARNILIFQGKTQDLSLETVQEHAQGQPGAYLENLYKNNEKFQEYTMTLKEFVYS